MLDAWPDKPQEAGVVGYRLESLPVLQSGGYAGGRLHGVCGSRGPQCATPPGRHCQCGVRLVEDPTVLIDYVLEHVNRWRVARAFGAAFLEPEPMEASHRVLVQVRSSGVVLPGVGVEVAGEHMADPVGTWRCQAVTLESGATVFAVPGLTSDVAVKCAEACGFDAVRL